MSDDSSNGKRPLEPLTDFIKLPLVKAITAAAFLLWAGWIGKGYATAILSSVDHLQTEVRVMRADFQRDRWTRTDHRIWVYELERANTGKITVPMPPPEKQ